LPAARRPADLRPRVLLEMLAEDDMIRHQQPVDTGVVRSAGEVEDVLPAAWIGRGIARKIDGEKWNGPQPCTRSATWSSAVGSLCCVGPAIIGSRFDRPRDSFAGEEDMGDEQQEIDDYAALRRLTEIYASGCDRRDSAGVAGCFAPDGRLAMYNAAGDLVREIVGRDAVEGAIAGLRRYDATFHFLGQQSLVLDVDAATGETYCFAHHVYRRGDERYDRIMAIRYRDTFCRAGREWLFEDRRLHVDWIEYRPIGTVDLAPSWAGELDAAYGPSTLP
jgi:SnoaL-like domain